MINHRFEPGDRVRVKYIHEMTPEDNPQRIRFADGIDWVPNMNHLCGLSFTIKSVVPHRETVYYLSEEKVEETRENLFNFWMLTDNMLLPDDQLDFQISDTDLSLILGGV